MRLRRARAALLSSRQETRPKNNSSRVRHFGFIFVTRATINHTVRCWSRTSRTSFLYSLPSHSGHTKHRVVMTCCSCRENLRLNKLRWETVSDRFRSILHEKSSQKRQFFSRAPSARASSLCTFFVEDAAKTHPSLRASFCKHLRFQS